MYMDKIMLGTFISKFIRIVGYRDNLVELYNIRTHKRWWVDEDEFQQNVEIK